MPSHAAEQRALAAILYSNMKARSESVDSFINKAHR